MVESLQICMVTEDFSGYHGESRHVYGLAVELAKRGHEITVLSPPGTFTWPGVRVKSFPAIDSLARVINSRIVPAYYFEVGGYEIVHSHSVGLPAFLAKHARNFFITAHGPLWCSLNTEHGALGYIYHKLVTERNLKAANDKGCVFCISPQDHQLCLRLGFRNSHLLPVYVDLESIQAADGKAFRERYGIDNLMVLEVARFLEFKGQLRFLRDCAEKIQKKFDVSFVFVGTKSDEKYIQRIEEEVKNRKLENVFILTDLSDGEMYSAYKACDVFILPSEFEGRPQVIFEAFAARKPVVATDVGGVREAVGSNCYLAKFWDPKDFLDKTVRLLQSQELRKEIGEKAYRFVKQFSWSGLAEFVESRYKMALSKEG